MKSIIEKSKIKLWGILAVVIMAALIIGVAAGFYAAPQSVSAQEVKGFFLDINQDGRIDYVIDARVILNTIPLGSTPTPVALP